MVAGGWGVEDMRRCRSRVQTFSDKVSSGASNVEHGDRVNNTVMYTRYL